MRRASQDGGTGLRHANPVNALRLEVTRVAADEAASGRAIFPGSKQKVLSEYNLGAWQNRHVR